MKLVEPLNKLLEDVTSGEFVLVEYDSISQFPLLPLKLAVENEGVLVEIGDKLSVKIPALLKRFEGYKEKLKKLKILNVSNYKLEIEGFDIHNVPLAELMSVITNIYSVLTENRDKIIVIDGMEILFMYYKTKNVLKDIAGLKITLSNSTIFCFVNYEVMLKRDLALLESLATTVLRFKGVLGREIVRYGYVIKTLSPIRSESVTL